MNTNEIRLVRLGLILSIAALTCALLALAFAVRGANHPVFSSIATWSSGGEPPLPARPVRRKTRDEREAELQREIEASKARDRAAEAK